MVYGQQQQRFVAMMAKVVLLQVATPICYDQFANAEEIEKLGGSGAYFVMSPQCCPGIGRSINFTDITGPKLAEILHQVFLY